MDSWLFSNVKKCLAHQLHRGEQEENNEVNHNFLVSKIKIKTQEYLPPTVTLLTLCVELTCICSSAPVKLSTK